MSATNWSHERRPAIPRLLPRRLRSLHTVALILVVLLVGWLGWVWYRGSSFVKVEHVTVTGLSGPDVSQIRAALTDSALSMTTLNMNISKLESAVESYPYVQSIAVSRHGAHAITVNVTEQVPVALIEIAGQNQVVDSRDEILQSTTIPHGELPEVPLRSAPVGESVTAAGARASIAVLAAAPYGLMPHIENATMSALHGVIVQLRNGPQLYFGPTDDLTQKWAAAVAVLQNRDSADADYIDVSDPSRPAAGTGISNTRAVALGLAEPVAPTRKSKATAASTKATTTATPATSTPSGP
jgi:cell division protein FtsQ